MQQEGGHADGQSGGIQVKALVDLGGMGQSCRQEEADAHAHQHRQAQTGPMEAQGLGMGIAEEHLGDQRGDARGEQHGVHLAGELFPLHGGIQHHAQHGEPHVQHVDAPGAEAQGQHKGQGGHVVHRGFQKVIQARQHKAQQGHVQERGRKPAQRKIVGGNFAGGGQNLPQSGEHFAPVRHTECAHQEAGGQEQEKQLQKVGFGQFIQSFHGIFSLKTGGPSLAPLRPNGIMPALRPPQRASSARWWSRCPRRRARG